MTNLKALLQALDRLTTALEQLTPAVVQASREATQARLRPDDETYSGTERWYGPAGPSKEDAGSMPIHGEFDAANIDRTDIEEMQADIRRIYRIVTTE